MCEMIWFSDVTPSHRLIKLSSPVKTAPVCWSSTSNGCLLLSSLSPSIALKFSLIWNILRWMRHWMPKQTRTEIKNWVCSERVWNHCLMLHAGVWQKPYSHIVYPTMSSELFSLCFVNIAEIYLFSVYTVSNFLSFLVWKYKVQSSPWPKTEFDTLGLRQF